MLSSLRNLRSELSAYVRVFAHPEAMGREALGLVDLDCLGGVGNYSRRVTHGPLE